MNNVKIELAGVKCVTVPPTGIIRTMRLRPTGGQITIKGFQVFRQSSGVSEFAVVDFRLNGDFQATTTDFVVSGGSGATQPEKGVNVQVGREIYLNERCTELAFLLPASVGVNILYQ